MSSHWGPLQRPLVAVGRGGSCPQQTLLLGRSRTWRAGRLEGPRHTGAQARVPRRVQQVATEVAGPIPTSVGGDVCGDLGTCLGARVLCGRAGTGVEVWGWARGCTQGHGTCVVAWGRADVRGGVRAGVVTCAGTCVMAWRRGDVRVGVVTCAGPCVVAWGRGVVRGGVVTCAETGAGTRVPGPGPQPPCSHPSF